MSGTVELVVGIGRGRTGRTVRLVADEVVLGRAEDCDIRVAEDLVSRRHCALRRGQRSWQLVDLDSANGTFLNRRRIARAEVRPGDLFRLGEGGPKVAVVALPGEEGIDLDATRRVRVAAPRQAAPGRSARPPAYEVTVPAEDAPPPAPRRARAGFPWLLAAGLAAGVALALGALPDRELARRLCAPALWGLAGARRVDAIAHASWFDAVWIFTFFSGAFWGCLGWALQRVRRAWPALLLLAGALAAGLLGVGA